MSPNPLQPLIEAVIHWALWFIPVLLVIAALKVLFSARLKGAAGERAVARVLNRLGEAALHDIILPDGRGGLTQIDHVVLTQAGLLVVETKNYAGQVLGQTQDKTWTQRLGKIEFHLPEPVAAELSPHAGPASLDARRADSRAGGLYRRDPVP